MSFDPFHVVALSSRALDQVRRAEAKTEPDLRGSRWALLRDARGWNGAQLNLMHWLQRNGLKTARAWRLKEALRSLHETGRCPQEAGHLLDRWISWGRRCRLPAFKRLAATVRTHRDAILEHFRSGLSNGFIDAMNAQIQAAKARAKGYATDQTLIAIRYLLCAKLKHLPGNPWIAQKVT